MTTEATNGAEKRAFPTDGEIYRAMEEARGSQAEAAKLLGVTTDDIKVRVFHCDELRARWGTDKGVTPPDAIDGLSREIITPDAERLARAYADETRRFRSNICKSPLSNQQKSIALDLQEMSEDCFKQLMDLSNASLWMLIPMMTEQAQKVLRRLDPVREQVGAMGGEVTEERVALVDEEKALHSQFMETADGLRKIHTASMQGANYLALIKFRMKTGEKKAKPGFQPIDVSPTNPTP